MVPGFSDIDKDTARQVVARAIDSRGEGWLTIEEARSVLSSFGIPQVRAGLAQTSDEAAKIANSLGFPVAMKLASQRVLHKSDVGARTVESSERESSPSGVR